MERLFALYRGTSSPVAVVSLVVVNLVPLVGVLFWGWNLQSILVLYWLENGIVGLINVPKILLARGAGDVPTILKGVVAGFFLIHYGLFWLVHGLFVLTFLPMFASMSAGPMLDPGAGFDGTFPAIGVDVASAATHGAGGDAIAGAAVLIAVSHLLSFLFNYVGRREYLTASPMRQAGAPYARVVVLHLTILFGGFISIALGNPIGALVALVALKIALDLGLHLRERRAAVQRQVDPPPAGATAL
ncbi:MAG: DUF6498-containing protein [Chloroflexota bacterium]